MSLNLLQDFYKQTITIACGAIAENIYVATKPTRTNGYLVISPSNTTLREVIRYTGTGTDSNGDYVTVADIADRGLGGTTAQAHDVGETIRMNITAEHWSDLIDELTNIENLIASAVFAGASDASDLVKGISFLSVAPDVAIGTCTITVASPAVITFTAHGLIAGDSIKITTSGALPTGLVAGATYYVMSAGLTANAFQVSATPNGSAINTTGTQSGTHTLTKVTPKAVGDNDTRIPTPTQIANIPSTAEKSAIGGSQGVIGSTNKLISQDNTSATEADQSQTTQDSAQSFGTADTTTLKNQIAQSFIPTKTKISGVRLYKSTNTGSFVGTVKVALQADTTGSPSGSDLASVTLTNAQYLALSNGEYEAYFDTEYASLVAGNLYWIVLSTSTADTSNCPNIGANSAGGYASGSVKFKNTTDGWTAIATIDLYFKTLNGRVSQIVKTDTTGKVPIEMNLQTRRKSYVYMALLAKSATTATITIPHGLKVKPSYVTGRLYYSQAVADGSYHTNDSVATIADDGTITYNCLRVIDRVNNGTDIYTDRLFVFDASGQSQIFTLSNPTTETIDLIHTRSSSAPAGGSTNIYYVLEIFA